MSVTGNFGSFFSQPVSNTRNAYAPAGYNMPATQPKPNYSPYPMMGGMQFPFAANGGATNLANSIMGQGGWNSGMGLGQGTFVNPFGGYTMGQPYNAPNFGMAGLNGANNEVQILSLLQKFLENQNLFAPEKPVTAKAPATKKDDAPAVKMPVLSGKGTMQGNSFKSGDGEAYTLDLKAGQNYNLLSDKGVGVNGRYAVMGADDGSEGELGLSNVALQIGGSTVTFDNDGYLEIDGKKFSKTNDLGGAIKRNTNGSFTIDTAEYDFTLSKDSQKGIKVAVAGTNVLKDGVAPDGLWGAAFDGEVETSREIRRNITEKEFELERLKEFDFEEHNNIGSKATKASDPDADYEENLEAWLDEEVNFTRGTGNISGGRMNIEGDGGDFDFVMSKLLPNKIYNLFSDEGIQVGGKFKANADGTRNIATEYGFYLDGKRFEVKKDPTTGKLLVNNALPTTSEIAPGVTLSADGKSLVVKSSEGGEDWAFTVGAGDDTTGLTLNIDGKGIGNNDTRTAGLWGELMGSRSSNSTLDNDGAGYIRNEFGELTSLKDADIASALASYVLSSYSDTEGGWSNYEGN